MATQDKIKVPNKTNNRKSFSIKNNERNNEKNKDKKILGTDIEISLIICAYNGFEIRLLREKFEDSPFHSINDCPEFISILIQHENEDVLLDLSGLYTRNNDYSYIYENNSKGIKMIFEIFHEMTNDIWQIIRYIKEQKPKIIYYAKSDIENSLYPPKFGWIRNK